MIDVLVPRSIRNYDRGVVKAVLLALLAFAGPLQAQLIYACSAAESMGAMEGMAGDCCYDEDGDLVSPDCDTDSTTTVSPCMELGVADEADQAPRSQPDTARGHGRHPPLSTGPPLADALFVPLRQPHQRASPAVVSPISGSDTYLLTQRLRL